MEGDLAGLKLVPANAAVTADIFTFSSTGLSRDRSALDVDASEGVCDLSVPPLDAARSSKEARVLAKAAARSAVVKD